MGVDFWPADYDSAIDTYEIIPGWSYSGFHDFRRHLVELAGINLDEMQGFADGSEGIPWDTVDDAIVPFIYHSDCDGELTPEQCGTVGPRLRELVEQLDGYDKRAGLRLADLMDRCHERNVDLQFR